MKSIKRGRGPSMMEAIGSLFSVIFGIIWTILAYSMGAPFFFPLFGIVFIILVVVQTIYNFKNATGKNRYSEFDITENNEEPDPLNRFVNKEYTESQCECSNITNFCPYCGNKVSEKFEFCPKCGKKLP